MTLSPEARIERAKYLREWRKKNPGKQEEYNARKWEHKAEAAKVARDKIAHSASKQREIV